MATAQEVANFVSAWQSAVKDGYSASNPAPSGYEASHTSLLPNAPSGDNYVWNRYGERIGTAAPGQGYTDYSAGATNAIVNSKDKWSGVTPTNQRYLTATNGSEPSFMDYNKLPTLANNWIQNNPGSDWDAKSLTDLWKTKYGNTSQIPSLMNKYSNEFSSQPSLTPLEPMKALPTLQSASQQTQPQATQSMASDSSASQAEIDRLGKLYMARMAAGDTAGAMAAHEQANQIREAMGLKAGVNYDPVTGAPISVSHDDFTGVPNATPTNASIMDIVKEAILNKNEGLPELKESNYQMKPFEYTAPNYSVTSDPSNTSFIPTAKAKDRWMRQEEANADQAYKDYTMRASNWDRQYKTGQDAIANALSLLPMTELTAAQRAEMDYRNAQAKAAADQQEFQNKIALQTLAAKQNAGNAYTGGNSGAQPTESVPSTATERSNSKTGEALEAVVGAIEKGTSYEDIEKNIILNQGSLIAAGVNPQDVLDYLSTIYPQDQTVEGKAQAQKEAEIARLKGRPIPQKIIDALLPGGQFRR